nr:hypothetical protein BaRGS_027876 [Batillaria attramentaria]
MSKFYVDGQEYNCAEQFMMHQKAGQYILTVLFGDQNAATKILTSKDPRFQKKMGRQVKNIEEETWTSSCVDIVKKASKAKFSQNAELRSVLLATYPKILVEASPYDNIWGIGCTEDDQAAWNRSTWRGKNLLGFALTDVRNELMGEDRQSACAEDSG